MSKKTDPRSKKSKAVNSEMQKKLAAVITPERNEEAVQKKIKFESGKGSKGKVKDRVKKAVTSVAQSVLKKIRKQKPEVPTPISSKAAFAVPILDAGVLEIGAQAGQKVADIATLSRIADGAIKHLNTLKDDPELAKQLGSKYAKEFAAKVEKLSTAYGNVEGDGKDIKNKKAKACLKGLKDIQGWCMEKENEVNKNMFGKIVAIVSYWIDSITNSLQKAQAKENLAQEKHNLLNKSKVKTGLKKVGAIQVVLNNPQRKSPVGKPASREKTDLSR